MLVLNPQTLMDDIQTRVTGAVQGFFPFVGERHTLRLKDIYVSDPKSVDDIAGQARAKRLGRTWSVGVFGDLELVENSTGKVLDRSKKAKLLAIPALTRRYSFIVKGPEYQVSHLWRLKSGVYTKIARTGEPETQFNLVEGFNRAGFTLAVEPKTKNLMLRYRTTNVPLYSVLKTLGTSDVEIEKAWGPEIMKSGREVARPLVDMKRLLTSMGDKVESEDEVVSRLKERFAETKLRGDSTKLTLGTAFTKVNQKALLSASNKLLRVYRGETPPDNRDEMPFKELLDVDDLLVDRLDRSRRTITRKVRNNLDRKGIIKEIMSSDIFGGPIFSFFTSTSVANQTPQTNPITMVSGHVETTPLGEDVGGITSEFQISTESKMADKTQLGILDPVHTPEGPRSGITLKLALGVTKKGRDVFAWVHNPRTKKMEHVSPAVLSQSNVAFPDQYSNRDGKYTPLTQKVSVQSKDSIKKTIDPSQVDYIIPHPTLMFSPVVNLVPFLQNDEGTRVEMATRHIEQALPLVGREEPLVQVQASPNDNGPSFEKAWAAFAAHPAPVSGLVVAVDKKEIVLRTKTGKEVKVHLYDNFPLNEAQAFMHSEPLVKEGDRVESGQIIADTNFTKNGVLALGKNLRVAYLPYKGLVFEDGIIISESASKKLASEHLHKPSLYMDRTHFLDKKKFRMLFPAKLTQANAEKLDDDGIIRVGAEVVPGDVLVATAKKTEMSPERMVLQGIHKSLVSNFTDKSLMWPSNHRGSVVDVIRRGREIEVLVRTEEPAEPGDKLCYDEEHQVLTDLGWKPVAEVTPKDRVASLTPKGYIEYLRPVATHKYPHAGKMYHLETTQVSLCVTEDHSLYARPRKGTDYRGVGYSLIQARELYGKRFKLKMSGTWKGEQQETFTFPKALVLAGQGGNGYRVLPALPMPMKTYLMLLGMFLSEGNVVCIPKSGTYGIEISQYKPHSLARMLSALDEAGLSYTRIEKGVRLHGVQLHEYFVQFGCCYDKYIPSWVFDLPPGQLEILYTWLMWGDGTEAATHSLYTTTSHQLVDDVQRLCVHLGLAARVSVQPASEGAVMGRPCAFAPCWRAHIYKKKLCPEINHGHQKAQAGQVESWIDYTGAVYCVSLSRNHTLYVRRNGKCCWSGNSARHGNKGVISYVFPDDEMPHDADGNIVDLIMNPQGVPGRMNPGQVAETALARIAEMEGSPIAVRNFEPEAGRRLVKVKGHWRTVKHGPKKEKIKQIWVEPFEYERDYMEVVRDKLKEHGMSQRTELYDPETKESFGGVLVGKQYILKLVHQAEKKFAARAWGPGYEYSMNMEPRGGGKHGAQRIGELGLYALLAHGAVENIREFQTYKSDQSQSEIWTAVQLGMPIPQPQIPFAFEKFVGYLNALGLDVERKDDTLVVMPFTDKEIKSASAGELSDPGRMLRAKDLRPEAGGLFDPELTGGVGGTKFSHFALPESFPNPVFDRAIRSLLGLRQKDLDSLIAGRFGLSKEGIVVPAEEAAVLGPAVVAEMLKRVKVDVELERAEEATKTAKASALNALNKKVKYLRALKKAGVTAEEAYTLNNVLVLPPRFRPITVLDDGNLNRGDLNQLYRELALSAKQLAEVPPEMPEEQCSALRQEVYDGLRALQGLLSTHEKKHKGILDIIAGTTPKNGYFMTQLVKRKQDLSARAIIVPNQDLQLDQIGVPERLAMEIFRPFVMQRLVLSGRRPLEAREAVINKTVEARIALKQVVQDRPVLMKRDPVLHKYGVQAFNVRLMGDREISIHPLVCDAYNADFDGDAVSLYVPVSKSAVLEAYKLMPSNNLLSPATGLPAFVPTKEAVVGAFLLTRVKDKLPQKQFKNPDELITAAKKGEIPWDTQVTVQGRAATAGRELLRRSLPAGVRQHLPSGADWDMGKQGLNKFLKTIAIKDPQAYPQAAQVLKDLGFGHMHRIGFSFDLDSFKAFDSLRTAELKKVHPQYQKILASDAPQDKKDAQVVSLYTKVGDRLLKQVKAQTEKEDNPLAIMANAGVKPSWTQIKQILISPLLVEDSKGKVVPAPITSSYGGGMSLHDYWTGAAGVRKGITFKVQEVQIPGALTKQMVKSTAGITVTESDCKTPNGVFLPTNEISTLDRYLSAPVKLKGATLATGTLVTPEVLSKLKMNKISRIPVRSPLRCSAKKGICQKCYGISASGNAVPKGTNVGILASQSLGERGTQLAMRVFHLGGVAGSGGGLVGAMDRLDQVLKMPQKIPGSAILARASGKVAAVSKNPAGGTDVIINGIVHNVPALRKLSVVKGSSVTKGAPLSGGAINPRELLELTNLPTVQNYLVSELGKMYDSEGIKRRHSEVVVKALTSLAQVEDSGGNEEFLRGDVVPTSLLSDWNEKKDRIGRAIEYKPILKGVGTLPFHLYPDWLTQMNYQGLRDVLQRAAAERGISNIHGEHPIPGVVYGKEFGQSDASTY